MDGIEILVAIGAALRPRYNVGVRLESEMGFAECIHVSLPDAHIANYRTFSPSRNVCLYLHEGVLGAIPYRSHEAFASVFFDLQVPDSIDALYAFLDDWMSGPTTERCND